MGIMTSNTSASKRYEKSMESKLIDQYSGKIEYTGKLADLRVYVDEPPKTSINYDTAYWQEVEAHAATTQKMLEERRELKSRIKALEKALEGFLGFAV